MARPEYVRGTLAMRRQNGEQAHVVSGPRRAPLQGGWGPAWDTPETAERFDERVLERLQGRLAHVLSEHVRGGMRVAVRHALATSGGGESVRRRLEDAMREEIADELRERLVQGLRERVSTALRGTPLRDADALAEKVAQELRSRLREHDVEGLHARIAEAMRIAESEGALDPERVAARVRERMAEVVRERVPRGLRRRLREELRERVSEAVRGAPAEPIA